MKIRGAVRTFIAIGNLTAFLALTGSVLCSQDFKKDKPLPSVKEVMDHYVTALGGHDVIFKHKSMTIRGSLSFPTKARVWIEPFITRSAGFYTRSRCRPAPTRRDTTARLRGDFTPRADPRS